MSCQPSWIYFPYSHRPSHISPVDDLAFAIAQVRIDYKYVAHSIDHDVVSIPDPKPTTAWIAFSIARNYIHARWDQGTRLYVVSIKKVIFNANIVFKLTYIWCIIIIYLFLTGSWNCWAYSQIELQESCSSERYSVLYLHVECTWPVCSMFSPPISRGEIWLCKTTQTSCRRATKGQCI